MNTLLTPDNFVRHVAKATRQAGFEVERTDGLFLHVLVHGQTLRCNLSTAFDAYQLSPQRLNDIIQAHLSALRQVPPLPPLPSEQEAAASLLPLLNQASRLQSLQGPDLPAPTYRPLVAGLIVTYVFDMPHHMAYLNARILGSFGGETPPPVEKIHEFALDNLRKRASSRDYQVHGLGDQTLIMCTAEDGYAAARILLPDLLDTWARRIPGRLLIGVPNRDFLIAFSDRDPRQVAAIARQVRKDAMRMPRPLSASLLLWEDGRIREHQPKH
jgi:hypothetical protein